MLRYRLFSRAGVDLGTVELAISNLEPGETFRGHGNKSSGSSTFVPVEEDGPIQAPLTVQPAAGLEQPWRR